MAEGNEKTKFHNTVHHVLARSYSFYFLLFIISVLLDFVFPVKFSLTNNTVNTGILLLIFASLLIYWAQNTSRNLQKHTITKETFLGGPYSYTRSPTHWGLFFLTLGFGLMINSLMIVFFTIIAFLVTKFVFLKQEERILVDKYGVPYEEYKKLVKF